ncbi:MAG TPA: DUF2807 domain-containing protein [Bacteroidia bacterium]|nr:DUF2807 domain-containing protein [Bacteroidia bacterium]
MKKLITTLVGIILFSCITKAQDSTQVLPTKSFNKISLNGSVKINLYQGEQTGFRVLEGNVEELDYSISSGGKLSINGAKVKRVDLLFNNIDEIEISGSSQIFAQDRINCDHLQIDISGTGRFEGLVKSNSISTRISGTGKSVLGGETNQLNVSISGAGAVEAENLSANNADIDISGIGKVSVNVKDTLNVDISGNGKITFDQSPSVLIKNISGIGKIGSNDESEFLGETQTGDTVKVKIGGNEIVIIDNGNVQITKDLNEKVKPHWAGFELGFNGFLNSDNKSDLPDEYDYLDLKTGKSINVNFNIVPFNVNIYNRQLWFVSGLGYSINNYRFDNSTKLLSGKDSLAGFIDSIPYKKSKLVNQFITLPLLLEFNTSPLAHKSFHIAAGLIGGYRVSTHTKRKVVIDGDTEKFKNHSNFFMENFRMEATARIGYRNFVLYGTYALTPLIKDNKGPELYSYSIGVRINGWD